MLRAHATPELPTQPLEGVKAQVTKGADRPALSAVWIRDSGFAPLANGFVTLRCECKFHNWCRKEK
eukprot:7232839-Pyramimonas_sp.AAC.1